MVMMKCLKSSSDDLDSGWAWVILFATTSIASLGYGLIFAGGTFFNEWIADLNVSRGSAAWIVTIPMLIMYLGSPLVSHTCRVTRSTRLVTLVTFLFTPVSLMLTSFVQQNYTWLYLTHGLVLGVGMLSVVPCQIVLVNFFHRRLPLALAVVTSGGYIVNFLLNPLLDFLIERYGWRITFRVLSVLTLVTGMPCALLYKESSRTSDNYSGTSRSIENLSHLLCDVKFWVVAASFCVLSVEYQILCTHLVEYSVERGISDVDIARLLPMVSAIGNVAGRFLISALMMLFDRKMAFYKITLLLTGASALVGFYCRDTWQMGAFLVIYGVLEGGSKSQMSLVILLTVGEDLMPEAFALIMMLQTLFMTSGPVVVAAVVDYTHNYVFMFFVLFAAPVLATLILQLLLLLKTTIRLPTIEEMIDKNKNTLTKK